MTADTRFRVMWWVEIVDDGIVLADVKLNSSYENLKRQAGERIDVPPDRRFLGFDAYQKALDCLKPGDLALFATPPAFRWVHFGYAIKKGLHVFMEKPVTVDAPTTKKMFALAEEADKKNLKVGVGLMVRHCKARQELLKRIQDGAIGEVVSIEENFLRAPYVVTERKPEYSELEWQCSTQYHFRWLGGDDVPQSLVHNLDRSSWVLGNAATRPKLNAKLPDALVKNLARLATELNIAPLA